jgi:hypothetical protein
MEPSLSASLTSNRTCCFWTDIFYYVWRGGYPRWKDEIRPGYATGMSDKILQNRTGIFDGIVLTD